MSDRIMEGLSGINFSAPNGTREVETHKIENVVAEIFSKKLHVEVPSHDSDLFETGTLDSLHLVELVFQLEQRLGVLIPLGEISIDHFRSIDCIVMMLMNQSQSPS